MNLFLRLRVGDKGENYKHVIRTHQILTTPTVHVLLRAQG